MNNIRKKKIMNKFIFPIRDSFFDTERLIYLLQGGKNKKQYKYEQLIIHPLCLTNFRAHI